MVAIWSPETKFRIWFEIEAHATTALANLGVVPRAGVKVRFTSDQTPCSIHALNVPRAGVR